ncbi:MAG TPA: hypothetical protein PKE14_03100 [Chitinophagales bacterium]|nr:hypothetical protein [Chitinophagales bacterium]
MTTHLRAFIFALLLLPAITVFGQGEVGFGTDTPAEKADINGAMIIRGAAVAATPILGTIRWNSTDGMHDGRETPGVWTRLENDEFEYNGDYTAMVCGTTSTTSAGTATGTSTTASETPFATAYSDKRSQYLYYGTEIALGGLCAGYITQIGFQVSVLGAPAALNGLTVSMKMTTTTSLSGLTWDTGLTTYYNGNYTLGPGPNYISLTSGAYPSGFYWDGYSNIELELCYDNVSSSFNTTVEISSGLAYTATRTHYASPGVGCALTASVTEAKHPVLYLTGTGVGPTTGVGDYLQFNLPIMIGSPVLPAPYVHHGPGSITAEAIYDENVIISDYVFDNYFDGEMSETDKVKHADYTMRSIDEMTEYMRIHRHLPTIRGRKDWEENGKFSTGELASELWVTYETHALYLKELHERTLVAEQLLMTSDEILKDAYLAEIFRLNQDNTLTESVKSERIALLNQKIEELNHAK